MPRQYPHAAEHSRSCFLHMHRMLLQSDKQLHLTTRNKDSDAGLSWVMIGTSWPSSFNLQPLSSAVTCFSHAVV